MQRQIKLKKSSRRGQQGFTLMETCVALVIMMISALGAAGLFFFSVKYNSTGYDGNVSLAVAQQRLERLRRTPFTDPVFIAGTTTDTVTNSGRSYDVVTTVCTTADCGGSATLELITIQVSPTGSTGLWAATVTTQRATPASGPYLR
jgi:Tfp pilus assembly protein PilV